MKTKFIYFLTNMHIQDFHHQHLDTIQFMKTHAKQEKIICMHLGK